MKCIFCLESLYKSSYSHSGTLPSRRTYIHRDPYEWVARSPRLYCKYKDAVLIGINRWAYPDPAYILKSVDYELAVINRIKGILEQ